MPCWPKPRPWTSNTRARFLPDFPAALPPGKKRAFVFDLDDCFNYTLSGSLPRLSNPEGKSLHRRPQRVALARHDFEPQFFATTTAGVAGLGESSDYAAALNATQSVGVRQKLPLGGEIIATGLVTAVHELRDTVGNLVSASATLQANIPLLKGAGMVAQEGLIQTERSLIYEVRDFERFRRGFLVSVASAYFALVNRQRLEVINRFRSVESYIFITQRTEALFKAGVGARRVTQLDLQRAQQSEYEARNDLTNAIQQYELSVDTFKLLLGMPAEQALDVSAEYLKIDPPSMAESEAVDIAERLRLDLQTTRDQVDDAVRKEKVASNNLLPNLDLTAQVGSNTLPNRQTLIIKDLNYSAGFTMDLPLDRVAERNALRIAMINVSRAKRAVEDSQDQVAIGVRDSLRRVKQQQYLVSLQRSNIALAQRRKEFADIQFRNGQIDNRDYLDAETALLDAQNNFAQAVSALEIATLQFLRDTDQLRVDPHGNLLLPAK